MQDFFSRHLLHWYDQSGRHDLPWQQDTTPYHVWLSEIMLQQTQVTTVIPYYQRFTARFPDVETLAQADIDTVLGHWAGLGYYARGRNLHRAARQMLENHHGKVPADYHALLALPGIGRSTAGAIMSLAFGERYPILDGNVKRVLTRFAGVEGWPGLTHVEKELWSLADELLPERRIGAYIQAQMDLGATVCTRSRPQCDVCPLTAHCVAYRDNRQAELPTRRPKKALPERHQIWLVEQSADQLVRLHKRPDSGIWGGMWSFNAYDNLESLLAQHHFDVDELEKLARFSHTFTHFRLHVQPYRIASKQTASVMENNTQTWVRLDDTIDMAIPAPVKTLISKLN